MRRKPDILRPMFLSDTNNAKAEQAKTTASEALQGPAVATRPIQFRVSATMFEEFSEQAGRESGFSKGAKSLLFQKIWTEYQEKLRP